VTGRDILLCSECPFCPFMAINHEKYNKNMYFDLFPFL